MASVTNVRRGRRTIPATPLPLLTGLASRGEFYVRRGRLGELRTGGDLTDYAPVPQLPDRHHLFPDVPMLAYRRVQPHVRALCAQYGVPYVQEPVTRRFAKMARVFVGATRMRRLERLPPRRAGATAAHPIAAATATT
jgi:hypothetical protein